MVLYYKYYNDKNAYTLLEKKLNGYNLAISNLGEQGYITNDGFGIVLTNKAIELFQSDNNEKWFETFWNKYPNKVGSRRVRHNKKVCEKIFKLKIKTKEDFNEVILGLETELQEKLQSGSMSYMVLTEKWLREERWKSYLDGEQEKQRSMKDDI